MALKLTLDSLDSVPEALRGEYEERDGQFHLSVDGLDGLKSALSKERKEREAAQKQVKAWERSGKSPDEIQALLEAQQRAEEEKASKAGEWDKLKAQMNERHQAELKARDETTGKLRKTLEKYLVDATATAEIAAAKGSADLLLPHVQRFVKVVEEDGQYHTRVVDAKGDPRVNGQGDPLSIKDLVSEMRQSPVFGRAFEGSGVSGSGTQPSQSGGSQSKTIARAEFEKLSPAARAEKVKGGFQLTD